MSGSVLREPTGSGILAPVLLPWLALGNIPRSPNSYGMNLKGACLVFILNQNPPFFK